MYIKFSAFIFFTFIGNIVLAQKYTNWHKGFILQENKANTRLKDTINGEILYIGWQENPAAISFRNNSTASVQTFNLENCNGFGVNTFGDKWEYYKTAVVAVESSTKNLNTLSMQKKPEYEQKNLFLRAVCIGTAASLWAYNIEDRQHLFLEMPNQTPVELVRKEYYADENKNSVLVNAMYRQQLNTSLVGCKRVPDWLNLPFSEGQIATVVENYNKCMGKNTYRIQAERLQTDWGALGGGGFTKLNVAQNFTYSFTPSNFDWSPAYMLGLYLNVYLPRTNGHWSICNDIILSSYHIERNDSVESIYGLPLRDNYTTRVQGSYIGLQTMGRYSFYRKNYKGYMGLGMSNAFALEITQNVNQQYKNLLGQDLTSDKPLFKSARGYEQGLCANIGVQYKQHWGAQLRWQVSNGFSPDIGRHTTFNYVYLCGAYTF
jgi:hypothetical protein